MTSPACSDASLALQEPMSGTAPHAVAWVALEQNGPWGPRALTDSHLDRRVGAALEDLAALHDARPLLIRAPGRHPDERTDEGQDRRVLVASTRPGASWLLEGTVSRAETVLDLDWEGLRDGDVERVRRSLPSLRPASRPHLLVCTNGRRDVCCAVKGRPLALGVAPLFPGRVWETTHTSGHRFAPTAVLLPAGTLHGHLDVPAAAEIVRAAEGGQTVLRGSRGRSTWQPPAQAAELSVRRAQGVTELDALDVAAHAPTTDTSWVTTIRHRDGRSWRVHVEARESDVLRAESCGKALKPLAWYADVSAAEEATEPSADAP